MRVLGVLGVLGVVELIELVSESRFSERIRYHMRKAGPLSTSLRARGSGRSTVPLTPLRLTRYIAAATMFKPTLHRYIDLLETQLTEDRLWSWNRLCRCSLADSGTIGGMENRNSCPHRNDQGYRK